MDGVAALVLAAGKEPRRQGTLAILLSCSRAYLLLPLRRTHSQGFCRLTTGRGGVPEKGAVVQTRRPPRPGTDLRQACRLGARLASASARRDVFAACAASGVGLCSPSVSI